MGWAGIDVLFAAHMDFKNGRLPRFCTTYWGMGSTSVAGVNRLITSKTAKSAIKRCIPQEKVVFQPSVCTGDDLEVPQF